MLAEGFRFSGNKARPRLKKMSGVCFVSKPAPRAGKGLAGEGTSDRSRSTRRASRKNIGYAWVPVARAGLGTTLTVRTPAPATVVKKPFVDPEKEIPKS